MIREAHKNLYINFARKDGSEAITRKAVDVPVKMMCKPPCLTFEGCHGVRQACSTYLQYCISISSAKKKIKHLDRMAFQCVVCHCWSDLV